MSNLLPRLKAGAVVLTDALVRRATTRGVSEIVLADARCPGLTLRVRASGARTWVLRRTIDGKQRRETLGSAAAMNVTEARTAAMRNLASFERPPTAPVAARFAPFAARYRAAVVDRWKPSTVAHLDTVLRAHLLPAFGATRLDAITAADVAAWFYGLSRRSPGSANRVLGTLKAMLSTARSWAELPRQAPDPTAFIRRNRPAAVGRALTLDQLTRLGEVLDRCADRFADETAMIRLILLSGCRPGEIYRLRWSEVKADRLMLSDSKTGPRSVVLARSALALFDGLRRGQGGGYVFPHPKRSDEPRRSIARCWGQVRAEARLPEGFRLHDLRHTYASQAAMTNEQRFIVSRLLGHRRISSTHRYTHVADDHLVAAADRVSTAVAALLAGNGPNSSNYLIRDRSMRQTSGRSSPCLESG